MRPDSLSASSHGDPPLNWMFIDMNSYFASVEQYDRPDLRGRMVGVVPVDSENTSIIAASQEAKRRGVKTGTRVRDARQMCPEIVIVKARPDRYVQVHHAILKSVDQCLPVHKVYSIDEWAIRLIGDEQNRERATLLGQKIKRKLRNDLGPYLTCSIGIAPTRLLAKIASDLKKPDGLTVLVPSELPDRLADFSLNDLCGIGHGMLARLNSQGIKTVSDLWSLTKQESIRVWGSICGADWWAGFHGFDEAEIATRRNSMSHANVLDPKFRHVEGSHGILIRLVCRLGARLRGDGYFAQNLRLSVSTIRGGRWRDEIALPYVQDTTTLLEKFQTLWGRWTRSNDLPLKVAVEVAGLVPAAQVPRSLFDEIEKLDHVSHAIDKINQRHGASKIYFGSMHGFRHQMDDKIAFGRIPPTAR